MQCKCGNELFKIEVIKECHTCAHCGAYDAEKEEYIYEESEIVAKELERTEVSKDGQCALDTAFGAGCHMYYCSKCGRKSNIPLMDA